MLLILALAGAGGTGLYLATSGQLSALVAEWFPNLSGGGNDVALAVAPASHAAPAVPSQPGSADSQSPNLAEMPALAETDASDATGAAAANWPALSPTALVDQAAAIPDRGLRDTAFDLPPWRRYARPFAPLPGHPMLGILVTGLGTDRAIAAAAIAGLPADISLSFSPYAPELDTWISAARAFGHEVMIDLPMQPKDLSAGGSTRNPAGDPGPLGLLIALNDGEIARRVDAVSGAGARAFGLAGAGGGAYLLDDHATGAALGEVARLGLAFIDTSTEPMSRAPSASADAGVAFARVALRLDEAMSQAAIAERLAVAAQLADQQGKVLAMAQASPVAILAIADWTRRRATQGPMLVPASALMGQ